MKKYWANKQLSLHGWIENTYASENYKETVEGDLEANKSFMTGRDTVSQ